MAETIHPVSIVTETKERYLNYALSVIQARALPDVRDGLKPVQRRIMYTMYNDLHVYADAKPRKCSKIVGDVMGNYHPHGDMAIYDALVRLAQNWVLRFPLVDGQGNFGSVDGDAPAASRYTEARLTAIAEALMAELRQRTVDMRPNYDSSTQEPVVLPAQYPNLLVNGSSGIAVGMATNIPPHNFNDVIKTCVLLIENPEATTAQLLDKLKGPDFPLGGKIITDRSTLRRIYEEGSGAIKVQGEWKVESVGKKENLILTSIPYNVNKGNLQETIGALIADRKLPQLTGLIDESTAKDGIRIALEMKAGTDPNVVMAYLYKHTDLQSNFNYNMTCLVPAGDVMQPAKNLPMRDMLRHFLDFRFETVRRRFEYELLKLRERIHILEGFRIIFDALDEAIKIIRESKGKKDAAEKLIERFGIDEIQADAVLDAQLYRIAQMEIKKILDELKDKKAQAAKIEAILASDKKLWGVVKTELNQLGETYSERRRTKMASAEDTPEYDPEAFIIRENTNVVLTQDGWIKRVGRLESVEKTRVREGDRVIAVLPGSTHDHAIFFADDGTAYTMRMNEVPASTGYGEPIGKFFRLADEVKIIHAISSDPRFTPPDEKANNGEPPGPHIIVVTAHGMALRLPLAAFRVPSTKVGRKYVKLVDGDKVVFVSLVHPDKKTMYLAGTSGHVIHFPIEQVNILSGVGKGVIGIKLPSGETCLGGVLIGGMHDRLVVKTTGGKEMEFTQRKYETTNRGGKGHEAVKRSGFAEIVPPEIELVDWDKVEDAPEPKPKKEKNDGQGELFE